MKPEVKKLSKEELDKLNIYSWPVWIKEESEFNWHYSEKESCYILEGDVEVSYKGGKVNFKEDDFIVFPEGLDCVWKIKKAVKKHYKFG